MKNCVRRELTVLRALMEHNGLGKSGNDRTIMAGAIAVNGEIISNHDHMVNSGDVITIGKRHSFRVP